MTTNADLLAHAAAHARDFAAGGLGAPPARRLAILTCMDARIDPAALFGLRPGDAHVLRNAGGLLSEDALRSLLLSQRLLGTTEVWLVHHTQCGMEGLDDERVAAEITAATGHAPALPLGGFADARADLSAALAALRAHPHFAGVAARAFLYDVDTGTLDPVD